MTDAFLDRATARLAALTSEDDHLTTMLRGITQKRDALALDIKKLSDALELYRTVMGIEDVVPAPPGSEISGLADGTLYDAIATIMRRSGGRSRVTDLRDILSASGKMKGKPGNRYNTIVATMERFPRLFRRVGSGEWELLTTEPNGASGQGPLIEVTDFIVNPEAKFAVQRGANPIEVG